MPNPRAQKPLTLDQAVSDIKSLAQPAQALGDMMASTLRGSVAATAGLPGDIRELINLFGPEAVERVLGKRVMPTTEEMKQILPKATNYENPYESLGEFMALPKTGTALKAARYGAGRGAGALTRTAGKAISDAMIHQAGPLASGPLSALAPRMAMTNVVKPKGGNWETGAVEKALKPMKRNEKAAENLEEMKRVYPPEALAAMSPETRAQVDRAIPHLEQEIALNNWIDRNLTNYVKKEMGTPEDPVRRLAEEGISHFPAEDLRREADWTPERLAVARKKAGFPAEGMGKSPEAQGWEVKTDTAIEPTDVGALRGLSHLMKRDMTEPWMAKVPDETKVYMANDDLHGSYLGFDHILDVLRQDVREGRIRPEQLSKVSMEQAVRRTHEFDQEQARKMMEAQLKEQEGFPLHKEYPEGYKWIELTKPKGKLPEGYSLNPAPEGSPDKFQLVAPDGRKLGYYADEADASADAGGIAEKKLADALKYEGDTMGHCVGGYCPDVLEGRSRIFSLRDKKGEPHVTIEVEPQSRIGFREGEGPKTAEEKFDLQTEWLKGVESGKIGNDVTFAEWWRSQHGIPEPERPLQISQIKGKQNRAPKEEYLPYVQDFVRSGEWSDVGDFHNTGLKHASSIPERETFEAAGIKVPKYVTDKEHEDMIYEYLRRTGTPYDADFMSKEYGFPPPEEGMAAGGAPRHPTEKEREDLRKLRESFVPAATEAERLKRIQQNLEQMNKKVSFSDNPDTMFMEVQEANMAGGGAAEKLLRLARAPAKSKEEIRAVAERMAPQVTGEYVRGKEGAKTVAGKTQKQFEREKTLEHDIRPTGDVIPPPQELNIEDLKGNVMMGIAGDPTITGQTVYGVAGRNLRSPAPQHGGPLYGLGRKDDSFWASNLGAAQNVQNRAREVSQQYDAPVVGNYVMMGPDSYSYAQHFADTNIQNIRPEEMTKAQIEGFNKMMREGYPYIDSKKVKRQRVFPSFPGIENPEEMYLQFAIDPDMRKHFGNLMQMPTVTEKFSLPSGLDVAHAVTVPDLRDLEIGVTGKAIGKMRPEALGLKLSEHPTYSHDIPGEFMGGLKYPVPYDLSFPDTLKSVRENPKQAPQEFGSFKMVGPRQIIDQQLIDEIKQYEEMMKSLTGKAEGGEITVKPKKMAGGGEITAEDLEIEERPL